jgi:hypothetical protein
VLNTTFSGSAAEANEFYASLAGKTSSLITGTITSAQLSGKELLVISDPNDAFTPAEVSAIQAFSNSGGNLFLLGEGTEISFGTATNGFLNSLLTQLGSPLRLGAINLDNGNQSATGSRIIADPLTTGVSALQYGAATSVSGGKKLFLTLNNTPFVEYVPEPATTALLACAALAGLAATRTREAVT